MLISQKYCEIIMWICKHSCRGKPRIMQMRRCQWKSGPIRRHPQPAFARKVPADMQITTIQIRPLMTLTADDNKVSNTNVIWSLNGHTILPLDSCLQSLGFSKLLQDSRLVSSTEYACVRVCKCVCVCVWECVCVYVCVCVCVCLGQS